jgi:hypothetical protein
MRLVEGRDAGSRKTDNSLPSWPAVGIVSQKVRSARLALFMSDATEASALKAADFRGRFATPSNEVFGPRQRAKKVAQKRT